MTAATSLACVHRAACSAPGRQLAPCTQPGDAPPPLTPGRPRNMGDSRWRCSAETLLFGSSVGVPRMVQVLRCSGAAGKSDAARRRGQPRTENTPARSNPEMKKPSRSQLRSSGLPPSSSAVTAWLKWQSHSCRGRRAAAPAEGADAARGTWEGDVPGQGRARVTAGARASDAISGTRIVPACGT